MTAALLASALVAAVQVGGSGDCPSPQAVAQKVAALFGGWGLDASARVEPAAPGVRVLLMDAQGRVVGERVLPPGRCEDLALAVAVLIATWNVDWGSAPLEARARRPLSVRVPAPLAASPAGEPVRRWELGAGALTSVDGQGAAVGAATFAAATWTRWGGQVGLTWSGTRTVPWGVGKLEWQRFALDLGPHRRFGMGPLMLDVGAQALAGLLWMGAAGFNEKNGRAVAFDPGAALFARASFSLGKVGVWLEAGVTAWPVPSDLAVSGVVGQFRVPQVGGALVEGLTWNP